MITAPSSAANPVRQVIAASVSEGRYAAAAAACLAYLEETSDPEARAWAVLELAHLAYVLRPTRGDVLPLPFAGLDGLIERALADCAGSPGVQARLVSARAHVACWQGPARGLPLARAALAEAERAGDKQAEFLARFALHYGLEDPDLVWERASVSRSLVTLAQRTGDPEHLAVAHWRSLIDAWVAADSAGFDLHMARFLAATERLGDPYWLAMATVVRGARALHEGQYAEAQEAAQRAMVSGIPAAVEAAAAQLGVVAVDQDRVRDLDSAILAVTAASRAIYMPHRTGLAALLMASRRFTEARAEVELTPLDQLPRDASYLPALCLLADLRNHLQMGEAALEEVRERLAPYAGRNAVLGDGVACFGPVDLYLGCIAVVRGDLDAMRQHMEAGYVIAARMRARPWLARMSRDLAQTFGTRGDAPGGDWARETLAIAEQLGMQQIAARAREIMRADAAGAQAPRVPEERLGKALTPRESEILALLVEGQTAKAIADTLILSTRTVQKHVEHIYEKLGVQNRFQLMARQAAQESSPEIR